MKLRKPSWSRVPRIVRRAVERALGTTVQRAEVAHGGYGPTSVFVLHLATGGRAVFKGSDTEAFADLRFFAEREEHFYLSCSRYVRAYTPMLLARLQIGTWRMLLLEDVGRDTIQPGDRDGACFVARELAGMHESTLGAPLPGWIAGGRFQWALDWRRLRQERSLEHLVKLSRRPGAARAWLRRNIDDLQTSAERIFALRPRRCLLHRDVRADNLRIRDAALKLLDWTAAETGAAEIDAVFFAQTTAIDGLIDPEDVLAAYRQRRRLRDDVLEAVLSGVAAHFAYHAWRPDVWYLPALRDHQRRQLRTSLAWSARRLGLSHPDWLDSID